MIISNNAASTASYPLLIISALLYVILFALLIGTVHLEPVNVAVFILIGVSGVFIFYYLRHSIMLAFYYWIVLLWPYLFHYKDHPVKTSYLVLPILSFVLMLSVIVRPGIYRIHKNPIIYLTFLYTLIIPASLVLNFNHTTSESYSFLILWTCGALFFLFYSSYISSYTPLRLLIIGENILSVLLYTGFVSVAVGVMEYFFPDIIHTLYNPYGGVEAWGARETVKEWLININRVGSIIGSPNSFASFLNIGAIISLSLVIVKRKYFYLAFVLIFFISSLLLSTSRGGVLSLVITVLAMSLYMRRFVLVFVMLAVSVLGLWIFPMSTNIFEAGVTVNTNMSGGNIPGISERLHFAGESFGTLLAKPVHFLYGYGPSNNMILQGLGVFGAHNIFMTNLHFYGIAGLTIIILLMFCLVRSPLRMSRSHPILKYFALTSLFIFFNLIVHSLVDDVFYFQTSIMWIVFPLLAVIANLTVRDNSHEKKNSIHNND